MRIKKREPGKRLAVCAFLTCAAGCLLLGACVTSPGKPSYQLSFEVYWDREIAGGLREGAPVVVGDEQQGIVARVERKYDVSAGRDRVFAVLHMQPLRERLRIDDEFLVKEDEAERRTFVQVRMKQQDRNRSRPIENGMLIRGSSSSFMDKAGEALDAIRKRSGEMSDRVKDEYQQLKDKLEGD